MLGKDIMEAYVPVYVGFMGGTLIYILQRSCAGWVCYSLTYKVN